MFITLKVRYIAEILGVSRQAVYKRARTESWPFIEEPGRGRGGKTKKILITDLPEDIRQKINIKKIITDLFSTGIEQVLINPKTERCIYYFLCFCVGFFGKVIIDIINR